jgi:hypothetical protein
MAHYKFAREGQGWTYESGKANFECKWKGEKEDGIIDA